jgi:hypothetical protein
MITAVRTAELQKLIDIDASKFSQSAREQRGPSHMSPKTAISGG